MTADEMEMTDNDGDQRITVLFLTTFHDAREVALSISSAFPCAKRDERSAYKRGHDNGRWALKFERYVPDSLNCLTSLASKVLLALRVLGNNRCERGRLMDLKDWEPTGDSALYVIPTYMCITSNIERIGEHRGLFSLTRAAQG
ncbi:hypothetical protein ALC56_11488 [Trachymyrmex septentrionalis]|uniref:Uncharacterized protein n=1 Tax=Trachymyrmex septentrionalis TaxID=34720 RepID=A0A195F1X5_9HYME|nr:hypothetical protein ALC56_11488 [Trachymyrmex septentrionalis]